MKKNKRIFYLWEIALFLMCSAKIYLIYSFKHFSVGDNIDWIFIKGSGLYAIGIIFVVLGVIACRKIKDD